MTAFYNEIDPVCAQWLRNLIKAGHIAPGVVDERSIEDIMPDELMGYTQCHFFAGAGVWSLALRRAGWPDHRPIWTGSCPCQPFSASGKKSGFDDERHLWPAFYWLIKQCKPGVVTGEQVASKAAGPWLDLLQTDLEAMGYAFGALAFPSAGVGAPHQRDRAYWVGYSNNEGPQGHTGNGSAAGRQRSSRPVAEAGVSGWMADPSHQRIDRSGDAGQSGRDEHSECSSTGGLAYAEHEQRSIAAPSSNEAPRRIQESAKAAGPCRDSGTGPTNGFWRDADWLLCRDGKWRPVEPGTFPLADGAPARVGRLRAYGNAINAEQATIFAESVMSIIDRTDRDQEQAA